MLAYIRTPRAATPAASDVENHHHDNRARLTCRPLEPARTLWASRPLSLPGGARILAVRLQGDTLRVGLASVGGFRWVRPERVISDSQAKQWVKLSEFVSRK